MSDDRQTDGLRFILLAGVIAGLLALAGIQLIDSRMASGPSYEYGSGCPIDGEGD